MYDAQKIAKRIKERSRQQGIKLGDLLSGLDMGINTVSHMAKGQEISYLAFAPIADALSCSVDYLLGRTDDPVLHELDSSSSSAYITRAPARDDDEVI